MNYSKQMRVRLDVWEDLLLRSLIEIFAVKLTFVARTENMSWIEIFFSCS